MDKSYPRSLLLRSSTLACLVLALVNAVGWALDIPLLLSFLAHFPRMVPVTAGLVLVCTASLWLQYVSPARQHAAGLLGALAGVSGLAIIACYLAGVAPSPFLLSQGGGQSLATLPAPLSAAMFGLLGVALACLAYGREVRLAQILAMAVLLLAVLNLAGYVFRDTLLYAVLPGKGVSVPTTVAAILLASSALMLRPAHGIMTVIAGSSPSARIARRLLISAVAVPVLLGAAAVAALHAELYDAGTLLSLLAWGCIVLLALLIWRFAFELYRIDVARTRAEQDLHEALQHLREERDRKDVFLAVIAHELRNPLAPIRSAADMLRHLREPDRARLDSMSELIGRQVDHMVHLVDDLLDVSRIGRGQMTLDLQPVDMKAVVADAWEQVRPAIERKRHACDIALAPEPVAVLGDHKRLVQVLANLLGNAAKYTPTGGRLRLTLAADPTTVRLTVRDNGIGIDVALLPKVFDTFTQATPTPERGEGGLGLGLALVKRLSELHGGTVRAESGGAGTGSTFVVELPRLAEAGTG